MVMLRTGLSHEGDLAYLGKIGQPIHLQAELGKPSFSQWPVLGLQRAAKLLAASFYKRVVSARGCRSVQAFADGFKARFCLFFRCWRGRFHAKQPRVTQMGYSRKNRGFKPVLSSCK